MGGVDKTDNVFPKREKKSGKRKTSDNRVMNVEAKGMTPEDDSVELNKYDKKKKKREKGEKKNNGAVETELVVEKHRTGMKHGKKRKLECTMDAKEQESDYELDGSKERKKKQKKQKEQKNYKSKEGTSSFLSRIQNHKGVRKELEIEFQSNEEEDISVLAEVEEEHAIPPEKEKSRKNKKKDKMGGDVEFRGKSTDRHFTKDKKSQNIASDEEGNEKVHVEGCINVDSGSSKKRKKEKKTKKGIDNHSREICETPMDKEDTAVDDNGDSCNLLVDKKKRDTDKVALNVEMAKFDKSKRKKAKSIEVEEIHVNEGENRTKNKDERVGCSENLGPRKTPKKVKFSGEIEIFPPSDFKNDGKENGERGLVHGKRYSKDEDMILKNAVLNYIKEHDLGDDGVKKIMHCKANREARNCWKEISAAIPWRPLPSVYSRAHILFERDESHKWTPEEIDDLKKFHEKHGPDWRRFGDEYGKSRIHVKDTWRRVGLATRKAGSWSQDEYQKLFDLVNMDLRMKVYEEKKTKHGMLRDNIAWEAISQRLSTRTNVDCCLKWYNQLESRLVKEEKWASSDDFRLLNELLNRDYSSVEEVDWDNLLDHRPGDICRKRWHQMANHLGEHGNKAFADQVEVLTQRYCPDVLEAREEYENKTPVT